MIFGSWTIGVSTIRMESKQRQQIPYLLLFELEVWFFPRG